VQIAADSGRPAIGDALAGIGTIGVVARSRAAPAMPWIASITLPAGMPLRPDFAQHRPDPRLDRYRGRAGVPQLAPSHRHIEA
jgi:hypothetical protein